MQLIFTDRDSYRDKPALFSVYFGDDPEAFSIDEGGASALAAKGCSELVAELTNDYTDIFCACGTGTTAAGIINGIAENGLTTHFHAVPVFKNGGFIRGEIDRYLLSTATYSMHAEYHFGGYAKTTPELTSFIQRFISHTGIIIDPVYTGKMLYSIYQLIKEDRFAAGSKILAIHTGGIWGLLGMKEKFSM
jgi:1-aminocyclopropane-1-carboxylate deaminase